MARHKIEWTPETLATRECVNFHVGNWVLRKDDTYACRDCNLESTRRFNATRGKGSGTTPIRNKSADRLRADVERLESALAVAKQKLELAEEIERLQATYMKL